LKGLLQKIGVSNIKEGPTIKEEAVLVKKEVPTPISLSSLKKDIPKEVKREFVVPVKEASEEKKSSLKDLLAKTMNNHNHDLSAVDEKKPEIKVEEILKKEDHVREVEKDETVLTQKEEMKIEEPIIPLDSKIEERIPDPSDVSNTDSWQKRKVIKEVPEDILRKILE
jgi:hypothetical protein